MSLRDNTVLATLTTPGETLAFDWDTDVYLENAEFSAGVSGTIATLGRSHGSKFSRRRKAHGVWSADIRVRGEDASLEANRVSVMRALNGILDGGGSLAWTNQGGTTPLLLDDLWLLEDPAWKIQGSSWIVGVQLACEKPYAEDATALEVESAELTSGGGGFTIPLTIPFTLVESAGGDLTVTHAGDFEKAYPVCRLYGPLTNPKLINRTTGERLVWGGSIADGDYWEVDLTPTAKSVRLNGASSIRALDARESTWFGCGQGDTDLQLAGSGYTSATLLRVYMKSAWA